MKPRSGWWWVGPFALVVGVLLFPAAVLLLTAWLYTPALILPGGQYEGRSGRDWMKSLDSQDPAERVEAIHALGAIGADAGEAVPALGRLLIDGDRESRIEASLALAKMVPASKAAVPQLAQALGDPDGIVRANAATALGRLRADAREAVPALIAGVNAEQNRTNMKSFHYTIQEQMALALGRASAGTPDGVPALTAALEGATTLETRIAVTRALGEVGPEARPAVPLLQALLKDQNKALKQDVEEALEKIGAGPADEGGGGRSGLGPDEIHLPDSERAYLWEVEHHGNLLGKHGFGPLADALKKADAAALTRLLAADFSGDDLAEPRRVRAAADFATVERLEESGRPPAPLSRDAFVARLLGLRGLFDGPPPQVKLALMTLSPKSRGQLDGPWTGTAQLRLHGESRRGGPAEVVVKLRYEVPRPAEETLARPGWLRSAGVLQVQTAKAPHYLFREAGGERGLDASKLQDSWKSDSFQIIPGGAYVTDFDRDGVLDVLVTDQRVFLYRGVPGGGFEDVTARSGLPQVRVGFPLAAWADLDGDGWEDLILGHAVFRNESGQRFVDHTAQCDLRIPVDSGGLAIADFDHDGRLDLYATRSGKPGVRSWLEGTSADVEGNHLFRNKGDWRFEDVTTASGTAGGRRSTFAAAWLDADDDGWPDLHVPNEFGDGVLLINKHDGTFRETALADRPADFGTMGLAVGDVNNDGRIDVYCANMYSKAGTRVIGNLAPDAYPPPVMEKLRRFVAGSQLHLNKGGLKFEQVGPEKQVAAVGWAYGACLADLDNDGWLDVYATAGFVSRNRDEPDG